MDRRNQNPGPFSPLPVDFIRALEEVLRERFALAPPLRFMSGGGIYPDEIFLWVSIVREKTLRALTLSVSTDLLPEDIHTPPQITKVLEGFTDPVETYLQGLLAETPGDFEVYLTQHQEFGPTWQKLPSSATTSRSIYMQASSVNPGLEELANRWLAGQKLSS